MTRAKDISKIITDADFSGTLDVTGDLTVDTNTLKVDSSNNYVGIGIASPSATLHLDASGGAFMKLERTGQGHLFLSTDGTNGSIRTSSASGALKFQTNGNNERMRIDSSGNVGIGTSSPTTKLDVDYQHTNTTVTSPANAALRLQNKNGGADNYFTALAFTTSTTSVGTDSVIASFSESAGNSALTFWTDTSNGMSEKMRIDSAGQVGIGSVPNTGTSGDTINLFLGGLTTIRGTNGTSGKQNFHTGMSYNAYASGNDDDKAIVSSSSSDFRPAKYVQLQGQHLWYTSTSATANSAITWSERMRITSAGHVLINTSSKISTDQGEGFAVHANTSSAGSCMEVKNTGNPASNRDFIRFYNTSNGEAGSIEHNGTSSVAYLTSSDYRLKENVVTNWDATTRLKQLKPSRFNFIEDADRTVDGFLAHEVQAIVPEAISGAKDEVDADGNPVYQGIDQSKLVPLLVKTIQELEARITTLENA